VLALPWAPSSTARRDLTAVTGSIRAQASRATRSSRDPTTLHATKIRFTTRGSKKCDAIFAPTRRRSAEQTHSPDTTVCATPTSSSRASTGGAAARAAETTILTNQWHQIGSALIVGAGPKSRVSLGDTNTQGRRHHYGCPSEASTMRLADRISASATMKRTPTEKGYRDTRFGGTAEIIHAIRQSYFCSAVNCIAMTSAVA
jgi:hypothetical protein